MTAPLTIALAAGTVLVVSSGSLASILSSPTDGALASYLRLAGFALPLVTTGAIALGCLRGLGSRYAYPVVDSMVKPTLRVAALLIVGWFYQQSPQAWALAWFGPAMISSLLAIALLYGRLRRAPKGGRAEAPRWLEFWRYSAPLALSDLAQVGVQWIDVLMVGVIVGTVATGIYTGLARCIMVGELVLVAVGLAVAPYLAALFGRGESEPATDTYAACTAVIVALGAPIFICYLAFPRTILTIFGSEFRTGADALMVLSLAMLVSLAAGPILMILTMAGRSGHVLAVTITALAVNVVGNLVLIPIFGLTGAALSWGISILITNTAGWIWAGDLLDIRLVAPRVCLGGAVAAACFGIPAVASRTAVGDNWIGLGCAIVTGGVLYTTLAVSRRRDVSQLIDWTSPRRV